MISDDELRERIHTLLDTDEVRGLYELAQLLLLEYRHSATVRRFVDLARREGASPIGALLATVVMLTRETAELSELVVEHKMREVPHEVETDFGTWRYTGPTAKEAELEAELERLREAGGELLERYRDAQYTVIMDRGVDGDFDDLDDEIDQWRERLGIEDARAREEDT